MLNNGTKIVDTCYKILGKDLTNSIIESTAGEVFTSGPTIKTLIADADKFYNERGNLSGANFVLEGWEKDDIQLFDKAKDYLIETVDRLCRTRHYAHLSVKLTGLCHMEMLIKYNNAQKVLHEDLFNAYSTKSSTGRKVLTRDAIVQFLKTNNYDFTERSVDEFIEIAKFKDSKHWSGEVGEVEYYSNVHAHYIKSGQHNTDIIEQICERAGLTPEIRETVDRFVVRLDSIISKVNDWGSFVFLDAEQTYIQAALDDVSRQFQSHYHKGRRAFIMNGYQCYLKSVPEQVKLEIDRWREEGIGYGVKIVRGAYMGEERRLAAQMGLPSPVWDTIEDTHKAYNQTAQYLLKNIDQEQGNKICKFNYYISCIFISKNVEINKSLTCYIVSWLKNVNN